jgi:uncharacterized membrane protein YeaQ/YmgE (transglycosylase-associated protein family)
MSITIENQMPFPAGRQTLHARGHNRRGFEAGRYRYSVHDPRCAEKPLRDAISYRGAIMGILSWIVFGGLAGLAAGFLTHRGGGIIYDIIVGIVGALLGGFLMGLFGHAGVTGWNWRSFAVAVGGAIVLILVLGAIRGRGRLRTR